LNTSEIAKTFRDRANDWLCYGYALDVRYIAVVTESGPEILVASVMLNPLPPIRTDLSFHIEGGRYLIGQCQTQANRKASLIRTLERAVLGEIVIANQTAKLVPENKFEYFSEMTYRDRWFSELHLQVLGKRYPQPNSHDLALVDGELRQASPPFDGVQDACAWLGLEVPGSNSQPSSITIRVGPPVDLICEHSHLESDTLTLTLHAHPKFDVSQVRLAVRAMPGNGLLARKQIADKISWGRVKDSRRSGVVQIKLPQSDSVLVMLMIEKATVRRQWFVDSAKARNNRYLAVQHFDKDLRMIRNAVMDSPESSKFENGIAALLFLLGFTPAVQLETDSPDIVVVTPSGKLTLVECTTRTSDIATKIGKLVDRRGGLSKYLASSGHPAEVNAVLVCRSPIDQLPVQASEASRNKVLLVTNEDLLAAFERVRSPEDPDALLARAATRMNRTLSGSSHSG
jgi:hypothetical protein